MSPAPARTSSEAIVAAARDLLEAEGIEGLSMARVAERVGIRPPSLYKHVRDRDELLRAVATAVALDLGRMLEACGGAEGPDPAVRLRALATAYRAFARATPRSAALLFAAVAPGVEPAPEAQAAAARPVIAAVASIVGPERALAAARVLTAFAHGFTSMEAAGAFRFGGDVEEAYHFGIAVLLAGLAREPAPAGPAATG